MKTELGALEQLGSEPLPAVTVKAHAPKEEAKAHPVPDCMSEADVADPNNAANMTCVTHLDHLVKKLNEAIMRCINEGTRPDRAQRALVIEAQKRLGALERACGSGQLTEEAYKEIITAQKKKDTLMLAFFVKTGQKAKAEICRERISMID
jgi:hypothetical protein